MRIIATIILTDLVTNSHLSSLLLFLTNHNQESNFQQDVGLVWEYHIFMIKSNEQKKEKHNETKNMILIF